MTKAQKNFVNKKQGENGLDLGDKSSEKMKKSLNVLFKLFYWYIYMSPMMVQEII